MDWRRLPWQHVIWHLLIFIPQINLTQLYLYSPLIAVTEGLTGRVHTTPSAQLLLLLLLLFPKAGNWVHRGRPWSLKLLSLLQAPLWDRTLRGQSSTIFGRANASVAVSPETGGRALGCGPEGDDMSGGDDINTIWGLNLSPLPPSLCSFLLQISRRLKKQPSSSSPTLSSLPRLRKVWVIQKHTS